MRELREVSADQIEFSLPSAVAAFSEREVTEELQTLEEQMRAALGLTSATPPSAKDEVSLGHIEFVVPTDKPATKHPVGVEQASETAARLKALEKEMRSAFGVAEPAPAVEPPKPKPTPITRLVKRNIEVILSVQRADGTRIPFYHLDDCTSTLEAEINAAKKARKFGLTVLCTIDVAVKEREYERQLNTKVLSGIGC